MLLTDPRVEHRVGDGRAYLARTTEAFDIIEADALRPSSAYAGNLYSREYFELVLSRLKPGGLAVTWAPTPRIRSTFLDVYSHVVAFDGDIWIGSSTPIPFDLQTVADRVAAARDYFEAGGIDIREVLRTQLRHLPRQFGPSDHRTSTDLNTDMFPRDEFALPFW
jgi:spermidine synthase